jgi:hypothetical protein
LHEKEAEAGFVYRAWLEAKGVLELVRERIVAWLPLHEKEAEAGFVYRAWLHAGGEREFVQHHVIAWLGAHGTDVDADFVFRGWLEAGGDFSLVRTHAIQWLSHNCESAEAVYLTKSLAKEPGIPVETVKDILRWCSMFATTEDALWRLTQLGRHLLREEVAEDVCTAAEAVLTPPTSGPTQLEPVTRGQIATALSYLIDAPKLRTGGLRTRVDALLLAWLRHPGSYGSEPKAHSLIQRRSHFQRVVDLLVSGALNVSSDRDALERFLRWVNTWDSEWKSGLQPAFVWLKYHYADPNLWDIVQFPPENAPDTD